MVPPRTRILRAFPPRGGSENRAKASLVPDRPAASFAVPKGANRKNSASRASSPGLRAGSFRVGDYHRKCKTVVTFAAHRLDLRRTHAGFGGKARVEPPHAHDVRILAGRVDDLPVANHVVRYNHAAAARKPQRPA